MIVWGDHGWHLGEQGQWCKHTNFENATRAPLIVSTPGQNLRRARSQLALFHRLTADADRLESLVAAAR